MQRPLADYSRDEVVMLIDVVVTAYQDCMVAEHERMAAKDRAFFEERLARRGLATGKGSAVLMLDLITAPRFTNRSVS